MYLTKEELKQELLKREVIQEFALRESTLWPIVVCYEPEHLPTSILFSDYNTSVIMGEDGLVVARMFEFETVETAKEFLSQVPQDTSHAELWHQGELIAHNNEIEIPH
ncbi:hypothetical protein JK635_07475 [Neobacillus sp. YIM B02564]|uniref:Uncharacterized protein n=1 Tax=Neobacillus paridis TaxID=2803862 RepID=A0ABS1TMT1_9BACI|nr:hypothetical protein [Neobacillus paridis]MBL4952049.1 hypothetical protein [Neobacillus paridis]